MNTSKVAVVANSAFGKMASIIGYVCGAFALLGLIGYLASDAADDAADDVAIVVIACLVFLAISVFLIIKGIQIKKRINRFKQYVSLISVQNMTALENIAVGVSRSIDFVKKDLQIMIDKNFFANASINAAANEIVIGGGSKPASASAFDAQQKLEASTCSGCGASCTKPEGMPGKCNYCGSIVK